MRSLINLLLTTIVAVGLGLFVATQTGSTLLFLVVTGGVAMTGGWTNAMRCEREGKLW